jgi:K+-sensing histidine kinase KdpD
VGVVVVSEQDTVGKTMPCLIRAEELLCHCLLSNLLKNALEASPRGANVHVEFRRGTCCDVFIHNLGEVPAALRLTFFDKYTTFGKKMGTGLGTYSAKLMARTMGGDVYVDCSQPGKTQVRVSLPWCQTSLEQSEEKHEISYRR